MPFVWDAGGAGAVEDSTKSTINSPEAVEGVSFFADLVNERAWPTRASSSATARRWRTSSRAARSRSGWAARGCSARSARTDDENWVARGALNVGLAPMPAGPEGDAFTFVGGSNLMLFEGSQHKNEAWG